LRAYGRYRYCVNETGRASRESRAEALRHGVLRTEIEEMSATLVGTASATVVSSAAATTTAAFRATPQGGILEGVNPSVYDPKNPIILFIIQVRAHLLEAGGAED
jgi:hypothetical protein